MTAGTSVLRHRTAMVRYGLSQPVALLVRHGLLTSDVDVLDYGCGQGDDVRALSAKGVNAAGWDPHFAPAVDRSPAAVVNIGFVLNVIEDQQERREALEWAWKLTGKVLAVGVMVQGQVPVEGLRRFGDGYLTARNTFQKYFQQAEARDYIRHVTGTEPVAVAPGIFFVFRRPEDEQDFLFERRRGSVNPVADYRSEAQRPKRTARPSTVKPLLAERIANAIAEIESFALRRGRLPQQDELTTEAWDQLARERVSFTRACEAATDAGLSREVLTAAAALRREDLLVHHALGILNKSRSAQALSSIMVRDVRALFGSRRDLADSAMGYLLGLSDKAKIEELCASAAHAGMGVIDEKGRLNVLGSRSADLPGHLRCYIGCAIHLSGEPEGPYLIRLDPLRRRIKFFLIEGERTSFPLLTSSITVDLKRQDVFVNREHKRLLKKSRLFASVSKAQVARETKYASDNDYGVDQIIEDRPGPQ